jgi:hypothetical protein
VRIAALQLRESEYLAVPGPGRELLYEPKPDTRLGALQPRADFDLYVFGMRKPEERQLVVRDPVAPPPRVQYRHPRDLIMRGTAQRLDRERRVTSKVAQGLFSTWLEVRRENPEAPLPLTQVTEDGTVQMAWQIGPRYVDIEIHGPNELEWFFQDRSVGQYASSGESPTRFTDTLSERLRLVFSAL